MGMVKIKVSELFGTALDYGVACCLEEHEIHELYGVQMVGEVEPGINFRPSTDWAKGGPLLDKYDVTFERYPTGAFGPNFSASAGRGLSRWCELGPTRLISACRAIIGSKLGETVLVPKELVK